MPVHSVESSKMAENELIFKMALSIIATTNHQPSKMQILKDLPIFKLQDRIILCHCGRPNIIQGPNPIEFRITRMEK